VGPSGAAAEAAGRSDESSRTRRSVGGGRAKAWRKRPRTPPVTRYRARNGAADKPPREILVLNDAEIYKLKVSLCASVPGAKQLRVVTAALDTAAGAVLIADHAVPEGALVLPVETSPTLVNASGKRLSISGLTTVDVTIGILETSIKAWIVPGLPVPLILGTPFIGEYVELILPREKKVTLWDPRSREKSDVYLYSTRRQGSDPKGTSWVRTVAAVCVPPMTEMRIRVRSDRQGSR
jgi:hypothetical protein